MKKRYLFFDIDGTLLAGGYAGYIPDSTMRALERLREAGHFLAIATGRAQYMALPYMKQLGMTNMVSDGGNAITVDGELLGIEPLCKADVCALIRECEEKGLSWGVQIENSDTRLVPDDRFFKETRDGYLKNLVVPGLNPEDLDVIYKAYVVCPEPEEQKLEALKKLPWCRYMPEYFFVEPLEKAKGIRRMMDHLGAPYGDVIVFGDGDNDLSMFTDEWTKVAMGNATPRLKEKADLITTDVTDDGIWNACVRLNLFDP
ncbi:MAG: HAD family hydrolase [Candidatus Limivicinus sp.]|jgi:Cof subfamily protein (haloacid dehalogenase superfamily)